MGWMAFLKFVHLDAVFSAPNATQCHPAAQLETWRCRALFLPMYWKLSQLPIRALPLLVVVSAIKSRSTPRRLYRTPFSLARPS